MPGIPMLDVLIGLVFVYLLLVHFLINAALEAVKSIVNTVPGFTFV